MLTSCLLKIIYLFRTSRASGHSLLIFESSADKNIENYPTIDSRKEVERLQVEMFLKGTLSTEKIKIEEEKPCNIIL